MNYAVVDKSTKIVTNNIEWDGESHLPSYLIENNDLIAWDENTKGHPVNIGYIYDENLPGFLIIDK